MLDFIKNLSISKRLFSLVAALCLLLLAAQFLSISKTREMALDGKRTEVRHMVDAARHIARGQHERYLKGEISLTEAKETAGAAIRDVRYGDESSDYVFVYTSDGTNIVLGPKQELEGTNMMQTKDDNDVYFIRDLIIAGQNGGGYVSYLWPKSGSDLPVEKISYAGMFEPWGWVIGSGVYIDDVEQELQAALIEQLVVVLVILVVAIAAGTLIARSIARPLQTLTQRMTALAEGNLEIDVPYEGRTNEIGSLARALGVFRSSARREKELQREKEEADKRAELERKRGMAEVLRGMVSAGVDTNDALIDLVKMRTEVARTNAQAQSMATAVEELSASIQQISENSTHASDEANAAAGSASNGVSSAAEADATMEKIVSAVSDAAADVDTLARESDRIGAIVTQIEEIAEQTNLLALNATIEGRL